MMPVFSLLTRDYWEQRERVQAELAARRSELEEKIMEARKRSEQAQEQAEEIEKRASGIRKRASHLMSQEEIEDRMLEHRSREIEQVSQRIQKEFEKAQGEGFELRWTDASETRREAIEEIAKRLTKKGVRCEAREPYFTRTDQDGWWISELKVKASGIKDWPLGSLSAQKKMKP